MGWCPIQENDIFTILSKLRNNPICQIHHQSYKQKQLQDNITAINIAVLAACLSYNFTLAYLLNSLVYTDANLLKFRQKAHENG